MFLEHFDIQVEVNGEGLETKGIEQGKGKASRRWKRRIFKRERKVGEVGWAWHLHLCQRSILLNFIQDVWVDLILIVILNIRSFMVLK